MLREIISRCKTIKYCADNFTQDFGLDFDLSFNLKDKKDFDNTGRIFFTKKKGGLVVYTSTLRNTEQPASKELIENIKMLDLQ